MTTAVQKTKPESNRLTQRRLFDDYSRSTLSRPTRESMAIIISKVLPSAELLMVNRFVTPRKNVHVSPKLKWHGYTPVQLTGKKAHILYKSLFRGAGDTQLSDLQLFARARIFELNRITVDLDFNTGTSPVKGTSSVITSSATMVIRHYNFWGHASIHLRPPRVNRL